MKTRIITAVAVAGLLAAVATSDVFAAGRGNGGRGQSASAQTAAGTTATRPAGSQRRDGTFLTTGVTANGSTTRQGQGTGLMDGTCLTTPTVPTAPAAVTTP